MSNGLPGGSALFPSGQARQGYPQHWGNYASFATLPNGSGNVLNANQFPKLDVGDLAFVIGGTTYECTSVGTAGGGDAVWQTIGTSLTRFVAGFVDTLTTSDFDGMVVYQANGPGLIAVALNDLSAGFPVGGNVSIKLMVQGNLGALSVVPGPGVVIDNSAAAWTPNPGPAVWTISTVDGLAWDISK